METGAGQEHITGDSGDTYLRYTGDNYDTVAACLEAHDQCLAHDRSTWPGHVIFATESAGGIFGSHAYVRELRPEIGCGFVPTATSKNMLEILNEQDYDDAVRSYLR